MGVLPSLGFVLALLSDDFPRAPCLASRYPALRLDTRDIHMGLATRQQAMAK